MSGFIVLHNGRTWSAASWAYDAVIESIAEVLLDEMNEEELSQYLKNQTCAIQGPGMGRVDLRELPVTGAEAFTAAIPLAIAKERNRSGSNWHEPSLFPTWLSRFESLQDLIR